jgi:RNA polymerase sigma-70 factor (ECF subfamily)
VVALNRAVAVAMATTPQHGLDLMASLADPLDQYHLYHSARAGLLRRAGDHEAAAVAYRRALELTENETERRFLQRRLGELVGGASAGEPPLRGSG